MGLLSPVVMVAWYTTDSLRQFLPVGHAAGFLQLNALVGMMLLFKMDLLWLLMVCLRFDMQL